MELHGPIYSMGLRGRIYSMELQGSMYSIELQGPVYSMEMPGAGLFDGDAGCADSVRAEPLKVSAVFAQFVLPATP